MSTHDTGALDGEAMASADAHSGAGSVLDGGLQDSLDQIERLAAELKEIAEVITPPAERAAPREAAAPEVAAQEAAPREDAPREDAPHEAAPHEAAPQQAAAAGPPKPAAGAAKDSDEDEVPAAQHPLAEGSGAGRGERPERPAAQRRTPIQSAAARKAPTKATRPDQDPSSKGGRRPSRPAGPEVGTRSASASAVRGAVRPEGPDVPAAQAAREASEPDLTEAPPTGRAVGRSVVQPPLAPEPVRKGNLDVILGVRDSAGFAGVEFADAQPSDVDFDAVPENGTGDDAAADAALADADEEFAVAERARRKASAADELGTAGGETPAKPSAGTPAKPSAGTPAKASAAGPVGVASAASSAAGSAKSPAIGLTKGTNAAAAIRAATAEPRAVTPLRSSTKVIDPAPAPAQRSADRRRDRADSGRDRADKRADSPARRRAIAVLGAAALAVPAFALGALQPWQHGTDKLGVVGSDRDNSTSTEGEPPPAVPNPSPTPSVAVAPGPAAPGVLPGAAQLPTPTGPTPPVPAPSTHRTSHADGLTLTVRADDVHPTPGTSVKFTLSWKDGAGFYAGSTQQWGDGSPVGGSVNAKPCRGDAPSGGGNVTVTHTFLSAGTYTVRLSVSTYTCDGRTETQTVPMTIVVTEPSPTPSPTDSPSPDPSPPPM